MADVPLNEALSGIFGAVSMSAWITLLIPQLVTNYKAKSAASLSMAFLVVWLLGDVANLSGALVTGLAPSATSIAGYFCVSDLILIAQSLYYNAVNARRQRTLSARTDISEDEPLLRRRRTSSAGVPPAGTSPADATKAGEASSSQGEPSTWSPWVTNALGVAGVWVVGIASWFVFSLGQADEPQEHHPAEAPAAVSGMILGYASAILYLCARIPQIIKNYREKSTEGLSLLFFLLSLTGNLTYGASVISYDQSSSYILKSIPWLIGSLGTIVEDCIIAYQFRIYAPAQEDECADEAA